MEYDYIFRTNTSTFINVKLLNDAENTTISTANLNYLFKNSNSFSFSYYIEIGCENGIEAYEILWHSEKGLEDPGSRSETTSEITSEGGGTSDKTEANEEQKRSVIIIAVAGGLGVIGFGVFLYLIIKAKKTGNLKR